MNKEKIIIMLLLITIVLSVGSIIFTMNLSMDKDEESTVSPFNSNAGLIQLKIEKTPVKSGGAG